MKSFKFLLLPLFLATQPTASQAAQLPTNQIFIEIIPHSKKVTCGVFLRDDNMQISKYYHKKEDSSALWTLDSAVQQLTIGDNPLFFLHGFYAATKKLTNRTVNGYDDYFLTDSSSTVDQIIHVIWDSHSLSYRKSQKNIEGSEQMLGKIIQTAKQQLGLRQVNWLNHSMGNQFFMEALKSGNIEAGSFSKLILAAPDIDQSDFVNYFEELANLADDILVLYSKADRVLWASTLINWEKRVGIIDPKVPQKDHITYLDCSSVKNDLTLKAKINKHIYFLASHEVRQDIHCFINEYEGSF